MLVTSTRLQNSFLILSYNNTLAGVRPDFKTPFELYLGDSFIEILKINETSATHAAKHDMKLTNKQSHYVKYGFGCISVLR